MKRLALLSLLVGFIAGSALGGDTAQVKDKPAQKQETMDKEKPKEQVKEQPKEPEIQTKESGVRYQDLVVGNGKEAARGMRVDCHYTIWLADSTGLVKGRKIQSSKDGGKSFQCTIGYQLIEGWSDGMVGMKEGGTRRLFVPWKLGYPNGMGRDIPPKTNIIFEIEYLSAL